MLERMREFSKSWAMKGLLGLVALSFVAYFGTTPFQKQREERRISAVKVNGQIITTGEYLSVYNRLRQAQESQQGRLPDEKQQQEIAQLALDTLVDRALEEQWFARMNMQTTDEEVSTWIRDWWTHILPGQPLNPGLYQAVAANMGYSSIEHFEREVRRQIAMEKLANILSHLTKVSDLDVREAFIRNNRQVKVLVVPFTPENYMDQITPTREEISRYYEENKERYRNPERVDVDYIEIRPAEMIQEVTIVEARLEQFFNQNRQRYQIDPKVSVDYLQFDPKQHEEAINPSDEEIAAYYEEHPEKYIRMERINARYLPMAIQDATGVNAPSRRLLNSEYLANQQDFMQVEASHIFLRMSADAGYEEEARVREELAQIKKEIEQGKSFEDAARQYSQDATAQNGGNLGFVRKGQLPEALSNVVFTLGVGQLSEPIRGPAGFHLIKVNNRHTPELDEVWDDIARKVAEQRLKQAASELRGATISPQVWRGMQVMDTDFFEQGTYVDDVIGNDYFVFSTSAFRLKDGEVSDVIRGRRNFYVIQRMETKPRERMTLEEARGQIIQDIRRERAPKMAEDLASQALDAMQNEGLSLEEVAERYGLEVKSTGFFGPGDSLPQLGPNPFQFVMTAFSLQPGQLSEIVSLETGKYLIRGAQRQEARLPELEEVRPQVEQDYRRERSVSVARDRAYSYSQRLYDMGITLRDLANQEQLTVRNTGLFSMEEPISGLSDPNFLFHRAAFSLQIAGNIYDDIVEVFRPGTQEVQGFYLLQLKDRIPSHIPVLASVMDRVTEDLKREKAVEMAKRDGDNFLQELIIAKGEIARATEPKAFDLRTFAREYGKEPVETSYFTEMGFVPGIPGAETSPAFSRTAFALEPGQISGLIAVQQKPPVSDEEAKDSEGVVTGFYVLELIERREPDFSVFEEQKEALRDQLLYEQQRLAYQSWLQGLRAQAEIVRNDQYLDGFLTRGMDEDEIDEEVEVAETS